MKKKPGKLTQAKLPTENVTIMFMCNCMRDFWSMLLICPEGIYFLKIKLVACHLSSKSNATIIN